MSTFRYSTTDDGYLSNPCNVNFNGQKDTLTLGNSDMFQRSISRGGERKVAGLIHETGLVEESLVPHRRSKPCRWIDALHAVLPDNTQHTTAMGDRVHDE